jgi:hypothetical protein
VLYKLATCIPPDSEVDARRLQRMPRVSCLRRLRPALPPGPRTPQVPTAQPATRCMPAPSRPPARLPLQVKATLCELVGQMAAQAQHYDASSAVVGPPEAALHLLCRFYGGYMALADMRAARLPQLACLPFIAPGGAPARKLPLVHCSIMEALAGRVASWADAGSLPAMGLLHAFGRTLALNIRVSARCPCAAAPPACRRTRACWQLQVPPGGVSS